MSGMNYETLPETVKLGDAYTSKVSDVLVTARYKSGGGRTYDLFFVHGNGIHDSWQDQSRDELLSKFPTGWGVIDPLGSVTTGFGRCTLTFTPPAVTYQVKVTMEVEAKPNLSWLVEAKVREALEATHDKVHIYDIEVTK